MITYWTWSPLMPARSRAAEMATPPRSIAVKLLRAPESFPMGVRAPATMTEPGIAEPLSALFRQAVGPARRPGGGKLPRAPAREVPGYVSVFTRIDHVGIAVNDLEKSIAWYETNFGLTVVAQEINEEQGVHEAMLLVHDGTTGGSHVQLLEPPRPDSPIGKYLAKHPPGIHHIAYGVDGV